MTTLTDWMSMPRVNKSGRKGNECVHDERLMLDKKMKNDRERQKIHQKNSELKRNVPDVTKCRVAPLRNS